MAPPEGSTSGRSPGVIIGSPALSVEMPGFRSTIPSFGYSQASSSAGSLIPPTGHAIGFYQVQNATEDPSHQGTSDLHNTPSSRSLNSLIINAEKADCTGLNPLWIGSSAQQIDPGTPAVSHSSTSHNTPGFLSTPGSMATPRPHAPIMDTVATPIAIDGDSFTSPTSSKSTGRMTIRSFGTPRAINSPDTGIPFPGQGTARSFKSRHGYIVTDAGTPIIERDASIALGLGIFVDSHESPSFADEVDAEMARCQRPILPSHMDSLHDASNSHNIADVLNQLNEMDPAFTRAVQGLRIGSWDREVGKNEQDDEVAEDDAETSESRKKDKKDKSKKKKKARKHWF